MAKREYKERLIILKRVKQEVGVIQGMIKSNTTTIKDQFQLWFQRLQSVSHEHQSDHQRLFEKKILTKDHHDLERTRSADSGIKKKQGFQQQHDTEGPNVRHSLSFSATSRFESKSSRNEYAKNDEANDNALFMAAREELLARKNAK